MCIYAHEHCLLLKTQTDMCLRSVSLLLLLMLLLAPLDATTADEATFGGQEEEDADDLIAIQVVFRVCICGICMHGMYK